MKRENNHLYQKLPNPIDTIKVILSQLFIGKTIGQFSVSRQTVVGLVNFQKVFRYVYKLSENYHSVRLVQHQRLKAFPVLFLLHTHKLKGQSLPSKPCLLHICISVINKYLVSVFIFVNQQYFFNQMLQRQNYPLCLRHHQFLVKRIMGLS